MNIRSLRRSAIPGAILALCALGASLLPILNAGRIAALLGADKSIVSIFAQLHYAQLKPAYLPLLPGTLVLALTAAPAFRASFAKRTCFVVLTFLAWLVLCAVCFLMLEVNRIPVHSALIILTDWIKGGILSEL